MVYLCLYTLIEYCVPRLLRFTHWKVFHTFWLTAVHRLSSVAIVLRVASAYKDSGDFCLQPPLVRCHLPATAHTPPPPPCTLLPMVMSGRLQREISVHFFFEVGLLWFSTIDLVLCPLVSSSLEIRAFLSFFHMFLHIFSPNLFAHLIFESPLWPCVDIATVSLALILFQQDKNVVE